MYGSAYRQIYDRSPAPRPWPPTSRGEDMSEVTSVNGKPVP